MKNSYDKENKENMKNLTIVLKPKHFEKLRKLRVEKGVSRSFVIRNALNDYFKRLEVQK